ncbi:2'-5' RNA ligase family protein [Mesorhizobium amorphae]|uniref:2'-5' RNA ligase family protein n=1 Tax=Mesorhizobium amorphae TaxID=71433 RepID=UPI001184BAB0|nr:2'-5' RNA ligase family protein [Mesorhizobium amorphae]
MSQGVFDFGQSEGPLRPKKPERLILMVLLETPVSSQALEIATGIQTANRLQAKLRPLKHLHISLQHIRDDNRLREKYVFAAKCAANSVSADAFDVCFDRIVTFPGGRPDKRATVLLGGSTPLMDLQRKLGAALISNGLRGTLSFNPHITLFYSSRSVVPQQIDPLRFTVRTFSLVHSERGLTKYNILESC